MKRLSRLLYVILTLDLALMVFYSWAHSLEIPTNHLDGAFQNASSLHRLFLGQHPGQDFFPYLGLGVSYFLYPLYFLKGHTMAASLFACRFTVIFALMSSWGWLVSLFFKDKRFFYFVLLSTLSLCYLYYFERKLLDPGNSLRALRASIAYLGCFLTALTYQNRRLSPTRQYVISGAVAGACFWWSNDFGTATTIGLCLFAITHAFTHQQVTLKNAFAFTTSLLTANFVVLQIGTHGHGLDLLSFNFNDVRENQYWYFGPWKEDLRILSFKDIFTKLFNTYKDGYIWILGPFFWIYSFWKKDSSYLTISFVGLILFIGGGIATVGGHVGYGRASYFLYYILWCQIVLAGLCLKWIFLNSRINAFKNYSPLTVGLTLLLSMITTIDAAFELERTKNHFTLDKSFFFVPELDGYLGKKWQPMVNMARTHKNLMVLEEYWGLWSAINNVHAPLPVDSIIHALGRQKTHFEEMFSQKLDGVITTPIAMSLEWQPWNVSANWWFYKHLFKNFTPQQISPTSVLWRPTKETPWTPTDCSLTNVDGAPYFNLVTAPSGLYEIELTYDASKLLKRDLLMVQNNLNYAAYEKGFVSLPTHESRALFPVAIYPIMGKSKVRGRYGFKIISAQSQIKDVVIQSCRATRVNSNHTEVLPNFND